MQTTQTKKSIEVYKKHEIEQQKIVIHSEATKTPDTVTPLEHISLSPKLKPINIEKPEKTQSKLIKLHGPSLEEKLVQLVNLAVGSWVEFEIDGHIRKCRLAAKISSTGKYIFTNRTGVKGKECFVDELKDMYRSGEASLDSENSEFDRALESIISKLRDRKCDPI